MATVAQLDTRLTVTEKQVDSHEKTLNGNGKTGLVDKHNCLETEVDNHLEYHKRIEADEKKREDFWQKVILLGIGMILSNIGVIVFALIK